MSQRRHEFGVGMALGARPGDVIRNVMVQGIGLALSGVALGIITGLAVGRLLLTLLYEVSAIDPTTFAGCGDRSTRRCRPRLLCDGAARHHC